MSIVREMIMIKWIRYRFYTKSEDYRPLLFNPAYPWWCSGHTDEAAIIIAFLPVGESLEKYWPEAEAVDAESRDLFFTDRFPKPDWYEPDYTGPSMGITECSEYYGETG